MLDTLNDSLRRRMHRMSVDNLEQGRELLQLQRTPGAVEEYGCNSVAHYANLKLQCPGYKARRLMKVAEKLECLPQLTRSLERGEFSWDYVEMIIDYVQPETEGEYVRLGREHSLDQVRRFLRDLDAATKALPTVEMTLQVTLETFWMWERASNKLNEDAGRKLSEDEKLQRVSALVIVGSSDDKAVATLKKQIEHDMLARQFRASNFLAKFPDVIPEGELKVVLQHIGPVASTFNQRTRFNAQRRALTEAQKQECRRREGYCCGTPGCEHTMFLHAHHIIYWHNGGETLPENIVVLCSACHRLIHEGHLILVGTSPHGLTFRDRHGQQLEKFIPFVPEPDIDDLRGSSRN